MSTGTLSSAEGKGCHDLTINELRHAVPTALSGGKLTYPKAFGFQLLFGFCNFRFRSNWNRRLRKGLLALCPSLSSLRTVTLETVRKLVWLNRDCSMVVLFYCDRSMLVWLNTDCSRLVLLNKDYYILVWLYTDCSRLIWLNTDCSRLVWLTQIVLGWSS